MVVGMAVDVKLRLLHERVDDFFAVIIHGNAEHGESFAGIFVLEVDHPGDFHAARLAPGGPEVHEHHLALHARQRNFVALQVLEGDIRSVAGLLRGRFGVCSLLLAGVSVPSMAFNGLFKKESLFESQVRRLAKTNPPIEQQQNAAEYFHSVQVPAKLLVELQKTADAESSDQKRNRQSRGIACKQKYALADRLDVSRQRPARPRESDRCTASSQRQRRNPSEIR